MQCILKKKKKTFSFFDMSKCKECDASLFFQLKRRITVKRNDKLYCGLYHIYFFFLFLLFSTSHFIRLFILLVHWFNGIVWLAGESVILILFVVVAAAAERDCACVCALAFFHSGISTNVEVAQRVLDNILIKWKNKY